MKWFMDNFLCCLSLRKGGVFVAVLFVVWHLILILLNHVILAKAYYGSLTDHLRIHVLNGMVFAFSALLGLEILLAILVIIGTLRRRKYYFLPWIIYSLLLAIAIIVWVGVMTLKYHERMPEIVWIVLGAWLLAWLYWWWMVISMFRQIHQEDKILRMSIS